MSTSAGSSEVSVPLRLDYLFLRHILLEQVYNDQDNTARVIDDRKDCSSLILSDPQIGMNAGRIRIVTAAEAKFGLRIAGHCWHIPQWQGLIEVFEEPSVVAGQPMLEFRVVDSNLLDLEGNKPLVTGTLWDWTEKYVHPRLAALKVNLNPALQEVQSLVPLMLSRTGVDAAQRTIESAQLTGLQTTESGIVITLQFNIPEMSGQPTPSVAEPALTAEEARRWEEAWQRWDAFLTFVIKQVAKDTDSKDLHQALLDVLLDGRYELTEALMDWKEGSPDPVRRLFLKSWDRLSPILQQLETVLPGAAAIRYLSFITAADALKAMDQVGEQVGFNISADGLRRLARMLAPGFTEDPLIYSPEVDPDLRRIFDFGPPLPLPQQAPGIDTSEWFFFAPVWAADGALVKKLNRWVPDADEIKSYLSLVNDLLIHVAKATIRDKDLAVKYHGFFRRLSLATAWQESCWRQFVKKNGHIKPLTSPSGAVGIMQVNPHVWRGFYEVTALRGDISYNATAGNEILHHYLVDYVIAKVEPKRRGGFDYLVRLTYLIYHGGPSQFSSYIRGSASKAVRQIAKAFWNKYQAVKKHGASAVADCYVTP